MSQQGNLKNKSTTGNGIETLTGDSGGAVGPDGSNNVNILSGVGISVVGNPGTNTLTISTTGGSTGTGTTIGAVTANLITIPLSIVPNAYAISAIISGFESTGPSGQSFFVSGTVRTTGVTATLVGVPEVDRSEDAALGASLGNIVVSGNNAIIQVTGVGGLTINWRANVTYVKVN